MEDSNPGIECEEDRADSTQVVGVAYVQHMVANLKASQSVFQEASRLAHCQHQRLQAEAMEQRHIARMQQFLDSGDPILVAEAMAWAAVNPGVLQINPSVLAAFHPEGGQ